MDVFCVVFCYVVKEDVGILFYYEEEKSMRKKVLLFMLVISLLVISYVLPVYAGTTEDLVSAGDQDIVNNEKWVKNGTWKSQDIWFRTGYRGVIGSGINTATYTVSIPEEYKLAMNKGDVKVLLKLDLIHYLDNLDVPFCSVYLRHSNQTYTAGYKYYAFLDDRVMFDNYVTAYTNEHHIMLNSSDPHNTPGYRDIKYTLSDAIKPKITSIKAKNSNVGTKFGEVLTLEVTFDENVVIQPGSGIKLDVYDGALATFNGVSNGQVAEFVFPINRYYSNPSRTPLKALGFNNTDLIKDVIGAGNTVEQFSSYEISDVVIETLIPPTTTDITKIVSYDEYIDDNTVLDFKLEEFLNGYSDLNDDTIQVVQIVSLPENGTLVVNHEYIKNSYLGMFLGTLSEVIPEGTPISIGDYIEVRDSLICSGTGFNIVKGHNDDMNLTFIPNDGWSGETSFTYKVIDRLYTFNFGGLAPAIGVASESAITEANVILNKHLSANNSLIETPEDVDYQFVLEDITNNISDEDIGDLASVEIIALPDPDLCSLTHVTGVKMSVGDIIEIAHFGDFHLDVADNKNGFTSMQWRGIDEYGYKSNDAEIVIDVQPVIDQPTITPWTVDMFADEIGQIAGDILVNSNIFDTDTLEMIKITSLSDTITNIMYVNGRLVELGDELTIDQLDSLLIEPIVDERLVTSFGYQIFDGVTWSDEYIVPVTINEILPGYIALGDSVSTGYGLADVESDSFVNKLAELTGDKVINYAVDGITTDQMLLGMGLLEEYQLVQLANAQVITLSIGGNNLLEPFTDSLELILGKKLKDAEQFEIVVALETLLESTDLMNTLKEGLREGRDNYADDLPDILSHLSLINPNATIMVQSVYNPLEKMSNLLVLKDDLNKDLEELEIIIDSHLYQMKMVLKDNSNKASSPKDIYAIDVLGAFGNSSTVMTNINSFDIHPNKIGHEMIYMLHYIQLMGDIPYSITDSIVGGTLSISINLERGGIRLDIIPDEGLYLPGEVKAMISGEAHIVRVSADNLLSLGNITGDIEIIGECIDERILTGYVDVEFEENFGFGYKPYNGLVDVYLVGDEISVIRNIQVQDGFYYLSYKWIDEDIEYMYLQSRDYYNSEIMYIKNPLPLPLSVPLMVYTYFDGYYYESFVYSDHLTDYSKSCLGISYYDGDLDQEIIQFLDCDDDGTFGIATFSYYLWELVDDGDGALAEFNIFGMVIDGNDIYVSNVITTDFDSFDEDIPSGLACNKKLVKIDLPAGTGNNDSLNPLNNFMVNEKEVEFFELPDSFEHNTVIPSKRKGNDVEVIIDQEPEPEIIVNSQPSVVSVIEDEVVAEAVSIPILNPIMFNDNSGWFKEYVDYLSARSYMKGKGNGIFDPLGSITRAEVVQVLANIAEIDVNYFEDSGFDDVDINKWYGPAIAWAKSSGVAKGYNNNFNPNNLVTRQDLVVMINRYLELVKGTSLDTGIGVEFIDNDMISLYAIESVGKMSFNNIVSGTPDKKFLPKENANRAETAKILTEVLKLINE